MHKFWPKSALGFFVNCNFVPNSVQLKWVLILFVKWATTTSEPADPKMPIHILLIHFCRFSVRNYDSLQKTDHIFCSARAVVLNLGSGTPWGSQTQTWNIIGRVQGILAVKKVKNHWARAILKINNCSQMICDWSVEFQGCGLPAADGCHLGAGCYLCSWSLWRQHPFMHMIIKYYIFFCLSEDQKLK